MWKLWTHIIVAEYEQALLYQDGRYLRTLEPGRHRLWHVFRRQTAQLVDLRRQQLPVAAQEILTSDHVPVRVTVTVDYHFSDPVAAYHRVDSWHAQLYADVQIALREQVAGLTFDQTLDQKTTLGDQLLETIKGAVGEYGLTLHRVAIRDITMPASIREMMLKAVEAERSAQASLIRAREEVAAARARANAAKLIAENPAVLRLKELETLTDVAKSPGNTIVFAPTFDPAALAVAKGATGSR